MEQAVVRGYCRVRNRSLSPTRLDFRKCFEVFKEIGLTLTGFLLKWVLRNPAYAIFGICLWFISDNLSLSTDMFSLRKTDSGILYSH